MNAERWAGIIHPAITVIFVFPLIGIVANLAWQTRQRRLHIILNCIALLLFFGQGITGTRYLFEIGLWTPPPVSRP